MGNSTSRPSSPSSSCHRLDRKDSFSGMSQFSTASTTTLVNSNDHGALKRAPTYRSTRTTFSSSSDSKHPLNDFITKDDPKVPDTRAWGSRSTYSQSSSSFNPYGSEQPPPYEDSARKSQIQEKSRVSCITEEDQLSILRQYDTMILLDDSSSMVYDGRWKEAKKALSDLADIAGKYDTDGITICFMNSMKQGKHIKHAEEVKKLLHLMRPDGGTYIGERLKEILREYNDGLNAILRDRPGDMEYARLQGIKPINIIIITDGRPSDKPQECIDFYAKEFDRKKYPLTQVGIQFVQIGNDKGATEYLKKLDGDLQKLKEHRDMVDTTPYKLKNGKLSEERLRKIMLGGILRRIDRQHQIEVEGTKGRRMDARDLEGFAAW